MIISDKWKPGKWYWCRDKEIRAFIYATDASGPRPIHGKVNNPVVNYEASHDWSAEGWSLNHTRCAYDLTTEEAPAP